MKIKTIRIFALFFLLALCLSGCKSRQVKDVEAKIDSIGIVTADSSGVISEAQAAYDSLTPEEQQEVGNYAQLENAHRHLLIAKTEALINAIGNVTKDSDAAIRDARAALDGLGPELRAAISNSDLLVQAEAAYQNLLEQASADKIIALIDQIGEVTLESGNRLRELRQLIETQTQNIRERITNEDTLAKAEAFFQQLMKQDAADGVASLIDGIGRVTKDSWDLIQRAREAYDRLTQEEQELVANAAELDEATKAYYAALDQEALSEINNHIDSKDYRSAIEFGEHYLETRESPLSDETITDAIIKAYLKLAEKQLSQGKLLESFSTLRECARKHQAEQTMQKISRVMEALKSVINLKQPLNGWKLHNSIEVGYGELVIEAGSSAALVKLENVDNAEQFMTIYLRAGRKTNVKLADGTYRLKYATGEYWFGEDTVFGPDTVYSQMEGVMKYETKIEGNSISYMKNTVILRENTEGNRIAEEIDAENF